MEIKKKKGKRLLGIVLAVALILGLAAAGEGTTVWAADEDAGNVTTVTTWNDLKNAITSSNGTRENPAVIEVSGEITAISRITVPADKCVKIVGKDENSRLIRGFTASGNQIDNGPYMISVAGYLILENIILDGDNKAISGSYGSLIYIKGENAEVVLNEGTILENNMSGAIKINADGSISEFETAAKLTINKGAVIRNNTLSSSGGAAVSIVNYGCAVFEMNGGEIINNNNTATASYYGGGAIYGASYNTSAIYIHGGTIKNNTSSGGGGGGAIYIPTASSAKLVMTGGEISGNSSSSESGQGGGVYCGTDFAMTGGTISGNMTAGGCGKNVYIADGTFAMEGDANIPDGLFLDLYKTKTSPLAQFYISSSLKNFTEIEGVSSRIDSFENMVVAQGSDDYTLTQSDLSKLSYSYNGMSLVLDTDNNQIVLGYPTEEEPVTFDVTSTGYNSTYRIYANGVPLILREGTGGTNYTVIYVDSDGDGVVTDTDIWAPTGLDRTVAGNRYTSGVCYIYGGGKSGELKSDTSVTMEGGWVTSIFGGSYDGTVKGSTKVSVSGGTVSSVYGAGQLSASNVIGNTKVSIIGGTISNSIFGGGYDGTVTGDTDVSVTGGIVSAHVCGGSSGTQNGTTGAIGGSTKVEIGGTAEVGNVCGGSYYSGTVSGDSQVTVSGGQITEEMAGLTSPGVGSYYNICGSGYDGEVLGDVTVIMTGGSAVGNVFGTSYRFSANVGGNVSVTITGGTIKGYVFTKGNADVKGAKTLTVGNTAKIGSEENGGIYMNDPTHSNGIDHFEVEPDLKDGAKIYIYLLDEFGEGSAGDPLVATSGVQSDIPYMELRGVVPTDKYLYLKGTNIYLGNPQDADKISVDVEWGAMEFTYTQEEWNPNTHKYEKEGWEPDDVEKGNKITVTNHSNIAVNVSYRYDQTDTTVAGSFADGEGSAVITPIEVSKGNFKDVYLYLTGKPEKDMQKEKLGTVTVTIGGGS